MRRYTHAHLCMLGMIRRCCKSCCLAFNATAALLQETVSYHFVLSGTGADVKAYTTSELISSADPGACRQPQSYLLDVAMFLCELSHCWVEG